MAMVVVGVLSGTSFDAVDAAVGEYSLEGQTVALRPLGLHSQAIPAELRARIAECLPPAPISIESVCRLDTELGQLFGETAASAIRRFAPGGADLVASHGQTVFHWVDGATCRGTLQLGGAAWIAEKTGTPVVSDLRTRDITRGGQGAPLASTLDALLLLDGGARRAVVNLGGIANITVRDPKGRVIAYDLGPANGLMDAAVAALTGGAARMDADGTMAARGRVDEGLLADLLDEPYYRLPPPKSTGKELFNGAYLADRVGGRRPAPDDLLATLAELTASLVGRACRDHGVAELVVTGGGTCNPALMARITAVVGAATVLRPLEEFGLPGSGKEAFLFGLLGFLSANGLEGTVPTATGARRGSILGSFTPGEGPLRLPPPAPGPVTRVRVVGPANAGTGARR